MANENTLNADLARILQNKGILADPEHTFKKADGKPRRPDILCEVQGQQIGIEAKMRMGGKLSQPTQAIAQADDLIEKSFCDAAIALIYPDGYKNQDDLQPGKVEVAVRTPLSSGKKNAPQWKDCPVQALPRLIKGIPSQLSQSEELSKRAEIAILQAFKKFDKEKKETDSIMANLRSGELANVTEFEGLLVDLLTCFMFHFKLDQIIQDQPQFRKQAHRPATLQECIDSENRIDRFTDAYKKWLTVDYKDILAWNIDILKALTTATNGNDAVKLLAQAAQSIQIAKGEMPRDVVGITFCNEIKDAKQEGAMYTTLPAATLLTRLMFHKSRIDWKNTEKVKSLRIVDFACGSGTLLIACANYILDKVKKKDRQEVANALFEQMLYGFDCNRRAIFQTATGLGMIAPSVQFKHTQLRAMPLGEHPEKKKFVRLGSLELLLDNKDDLFFYPPLGHGLDRQTEPIHMPASFHFAIMNPPFTIEYKRYKQERFKQSEIEKRLRERERQIQAGLRISGSHNTTGFIELVHKYMDPKIGKAGLVLPASTATLLPGKATRLWLAQHFHIQYLVVSYDPKRIFFSGKTNQGEMLLVLKRKKKNPTPTQVIKLTANPVHESDAHLVASAILDDDGKFLSQYAKVDEIQPEDMKRGDWSATQFLSNDLYRIALQILKYWTSTFEKQIKIKQMGRGVRGCAEITKHPGEMYAKPALWYHDTNYCKTLEVEPDCHVIPKSRKRSALAEFERVAAKAGRLKIMERADLTTVKNFALRTTVPSLNSGWSTARVITITNVDKETVEKAVCLILNSTPAKLSFLLARLNRKPSYVSFLKHSLNRVAMPLLYGMRPSAFRALAKVYDEWCKQPRERLPQAHECRVQLAIDKAICRHTGYPYDLCVEARRMLSYEPMVTGKRYQANPEQTNPELF